MSDRHLHIISFDVPYPANYGGVIDVFYRIKALTDSGIKVHLHCYEYGRGRQVALEKLCYVVLYYKRDISFVRQLSFLPYIVTSRSSEELTQQLLKDNYPILCEGLHTTAILNDNRLKDRMIFVRAHNVEHDYYRALGKSERSLWKRIFYLAESLKLHHYESVLAKAKGIFAIAQQDFNYFSKRYGKTMLLPGFNALDSVCSDSGRGDYVLYHGNLSVRENADAAEWLIENVFSELGFSCVIAGFNPSEKLQRLALEYPNITMTANPNDAEMIDLLRQSQINILVTKQPTGLKLKLLNALYNGRFCLVNSDMLQGTALQPLCVVKDEPEEIIAEIKRLMDKDFTEEDIEKREAMMKELYRNEKNAKKLIDWIYGGI